MIFGISNAKNPSGSIIARLRPGNAGLTTPRQGIAMQLNQRVYVKDQDISGIILRLHHNTAVILDDDWADWADCESEGTLEFRLEDLCELR